MWHDRVAKRRSVAPGIAAKAAGVARPLVLLAAVTWGGVAFALTMVMIVVFSDSAFPIRGIDINGELRQLHPDLIRSVSEPYAQRGFFMSDISGMQRELARDPWVRTVAVRRKWPDRIQVDIVEESAFARWGDQGFLSHNGEFFVLTDVTVLHDSLPLMSGPDNSHREVFDKYRYMAGVLAPLSIGVSELHLGARSDWRMRLDNGWQVRLGREHADHNLRRLVSVVFNVLAGRSQEVDMVDMRYEHGYAVSWKKQAAANSDLTAKIMWSDRK